MSEKTNNNPNKWIPMMIKPPADKQIQMRAMGRREVYDQATCNSNEIPYCSPHGFRWTHWRLTENNGNGEKDKEA